MQKPLRVKLDDIMLPARVGAKHKYVRHSALGFVLWPDSDFIWHQSIGKLLEYHLASKRGDIVSAGFVHFDVEGRPHCYGRSDSLGLSAQPEDTSLLRAQMGMKK